MQGGGGACYADGLMRIAYCANVRLPSERAHGYQIARVCDALASLGHSVTLFAPLRRNAITQDYTTYYGAHPDVRVRYLPAFDHNAFPIGTGLPGLWLSQWSLRRALRRALAVGTFDLLYTRAPALLPPLLATGIPTVLELHQIPVLGRGSLVALCKRCTLVACLTSPMRAELLALGVPPGRVIVEPDAVDLAMFAAPVPAFPDVRSALAIPQGVPLVGYAGQLVSMGLSKGVEVLLAAADILVRGGSPAHFTIAGGPDAERERLIEHLPPSLRGRVHFTGALPQRDIPALLRACEVLVYPAPRSRHPYYLRDTSPLKLFEYMAAERPIVCANLPPLADVVTAEHVTFAIPGDPRSFADGIAEVLAHPQEAAAKSAAARRRTERFTWGQRMQRILSALERA